MLWRKDDNIAKQAMQWTAQNQMQQTMTKEQTTSEKKNSEKKTQTAG